MLIFENIAQKLNYSKSFLVVKIFIRLYTQVEVRKLKSRKRITFLPLFIKPARSLFLVLKWIFLASKKKRGYTSFKNKLLIELLQILTHKMSASLQLAKDNNINAFKNRSNIHYRWQKYR